ncbi:MAG: UDP-N-acetylmuramate dehydrogenase [Planctomycetes bacterium]|nr:UDP-N-acetylmuramate dehydrogenase [Planctomycetota bacterium]
MKLFDGLESLVKRDEPLASRTWFHIGGPAEYFVEPHNVGQLGEILRRCRDNGVGVRVLGGGANLLVDDAGVKGVVIHLSGEAFRQVACSEGLLTVGAGHDMPKLVLYCVRQGWAGLECLTGIPGSVGGCVRMNAGGVFGDVGSVVEAVEVMDTDGVPFTRTRDDLVFGYRSTNVTSRLILSATLRIGEDDPHRILRQVKEIWFYKKNSQPLGQPNAGCIFKNPRGMSAGALIDQAGMKGHRVGGAWVSEKHANFILADTGARASDVLKLINSIREAVYNKFEVYLELELEVW